MAPQQWGDFSLPHTGREDPGALDTLSLKKEGEGLRLSRFPGRGGERHMGSVRRVRVGGRQGNRRGLGRSDGAVSLLIYF